MQEILGMTADEMHEVFARWNTGKLDSYLIEITRDILAFKDKDGQPLIDKIMDTAGQKGTGRWAAINALEFGIPMNLITESVLARSLSALKEQRVMASAILEGPQASFDGDRTAFLADLEQALYASKIVSYAQGYMLMRTASEDFKWDLNYGGIAQMWRGGCIIRSVFLDDIKRAYDSNPELVNLLFDPFFSGEIMHAQTGWRRVVSKAAEFGVPVPAMSSALAFYDGYRREHLPANMIQAQRDYFGAHTYERVDAPRGEFFHTNWTGTGGDITAASYDA